jgi:hypothetical protein
MRVKHGLTAIAAALLLTTGGLAVAQQSAPSAPSAPGAPPSAPRATGAGDSMNVQRSTLQEIKDNNAMASNLNINRKDLSGMTIYGSDGKKIAGVNKVLGDSSNSVKAVTADVGGFLGVGSKEVVIPVDKLRKGAEKDSLQVSMTKDEIQNLDQWADSGTGRGNPVGGSPPSPPNGSGASPSQPPRQ